MEGVIVLLYFVLLSITTTGTLRIPALYIASIRCLPSCDNTSPDSESIFKKGVCDSLLSCSVSRGNISSVRVPSFSARTHSLRFSSLKVSLRNVLGLIDVMYACAYFSELEPYVSRISSILSSVYLARCGLAESPLSRCTSSPFSSMVKLPDSENCISPFSLVSSVAPAFSLAALTASSHSASISLRIPSCAYIFAFCEGVYSSLARTFLIFLIRFLIAFMIACARFSDSLAMPFTKSLSLRNSYVESASISSIKSSCDMPSPYCILFLESLLSRLPSSIRASIIRFLNSEYSFGAVCSRKCVNSCMKTYLVALSGVSTFR